MQGFVALLDELDSATVELPLPELVEHVVHGSGLLDFHLQEKGEKGQARGENLEELIAAARQFTPEPDGLAPLQQFLDNAALDAGEAQADEYEDSVQLMTLHSAKGLEFPLVILAGMEAPPNYGAEYAASFRQAYRDLALQYRVLFVPFLLDNVAGQAALNQGDGVHPNPEGAAIVADTVWNVLKPLLDQISVS